MATISIATSQYATLTLTYTVSSTDTKTTITVTKIYWKTTRSGGWTKKYYWDLDLFYPNDEFLDGAYPNGTLPKGESTRTYTGTWKWTHEKTHSSDRARFLVNAWDDDDYDVYKYSSYISLGVKTSYTVSYAANGGTGTTTAQVKWYGESLNLRSALSKASTTSTCTVSFNGNGVSNPSAKTSSRTTTYSFSKWKASNGTLYSAGATYTANAATQMTAQWTPHPGSYSNVALPSVTRQNYSLNGWYTAASGGTRKGGSGDNYTPTGNTTLYAQWTQVYASPQLTVKRAYRCDASGNMDDEGEKAAVEYVVSMWQTSTRNTCTVKVEVDNGAATNPSKTSGSYSASGTGGGWYTFTDTLVVDSASLTLDSDRSYPVTVTVTDTQGGNGRSTAEAEKSVTLASAFYTIDVLADDYLYNLTEDTVIVSGKTYYVLDGGVYSPVASEDLDASDLGSYYEANGPRPGHGICFGGIAKSEGFEVDFKDIRLHNAEMNTDTFLIAKNLNSNREVAFGVGSGGANAGIWDANLSKWIIYSNGTNAVNVYDNGSGTYVNMLKQEAANANAFSIVLGTSTLVDASAIKFGRVVLVRVRYRLNANLNVPASGNFTNFTVGQIASGFRPAQWTGGYSVGDDAGAAWHTIAADGTVTLGACEGTGAARTINSDAVFVLTATYLTA